MRAVYVGVAGALGALTRYGIGLMVGPRAFPWATLGINVSGSFLGGLLLAAASGRLSAQVTTAVTVGFLGAYTTYSTFAFEAYTLGSTGRLWGAAAYAGLSLVLGIAAAAVGHHLGRTLTT